MRAIVQRVRWARVTVEGKVVGRCGLGLLALVGAHKDDTEREASRLAEKLAHLRVFNDEAGKMNLALGDLPASDEPQLLAVSNFTVYGDTEGNRRPSFTNAAPYERGKELFEAFLAALARLGVRAESGVFGAHMDVELLNDGPVTVIVDA
ncbi:MAG: D-tyrosyl-tRNA(Tyr) deacylase [Fimbriimonas ginsengisoli]|uniref:D-aminoacyl-tRNA deacylase n=1 Tax=Fimbriimonas ginsengisoli TaxID=1005039 RepID=A0A931LVF0_FIMGI|nr:D-tyrosyl-tRNA(Tyr) deacylase [Fimbriimonas ginsengisoli]